MNEKDKHHASLRYAYLTFTNCPEFQTSLQFIHKYLEIVGPGPPFPKFESVELTFDSRNSLKENLFRVAVVVFQKFLEKKASEEKKLFFFQVLKKMHVEYLNLEFFVDRLVEEGVEKFCEVFFFTLSSYLSQYYRGLFFKIARPYISENFYLELSKLRDSKLSQGEILKRMRKGPKLRMRRITENEESEVFKETLCFTGFLHSEVYCEDCIIHVAPFYQSIFEADLLLDISKKFPYAISLFFRGPQLCLNVSDSLYKKIRPEKVQKGRITLYKLLKPAESREIGEGSLIKLGTCNEFLIKSINFQKNTVLVKFLFGIFKSRLISYNFSESYSEAKPEVPFSDQASSKVQFKFESSSKSLSLKNDSESLSIGVSINSINTSQKFSKSNCLTLDDKSGSLYLIDLDPKQKFNPQVQNFKSS